MGYRIEVVWNREFVWSPYGGSKDTLKEATITANALLDSGDGMRVKKARVINNETDKVVWPKHEMASGGKN